MGLAGKLTLIVGALLFSLLGATSYLSLKTAKRGTHEALERQGDAIASTLNHAFEVLVDRGDLVELQRVAANTAFLHDVREVTVVDKSGKVLACTDRTALGSITRSARLKEALRKEDDFASAAHFDDSDIVIVRPLFSGRYASGTDSGLVGAVEVVLDLREMQGQADETAFSLLGIQLGAYALLSLVVALALRSLVVKPLGKLVEAAERARRGDHAARAEIHRDDELGTLSKAFNRMAAEVERTVETLEDEVAARTRDLEAALDDSIRANSALERANTDLEKAHAELIASVEERLRLNDTIRELSTPVMRVHRGILTMPIVGKIDDKRAKQIEEKLLAGIERYDADEVIVDLTGVPYVDVDVARALVRARRCAELLGARVSLVGLRADVAMSVVRAGLDLSGLSTLADLEKALRRALRRRGLEIRKIEHG